MKIIKHDNDGLDYYQHLCNTLDEIAYGDEKVRVLHWTDTTVSFDTVTLKSSFIFWDNKEVKTELQTRDFDEEQVTFEVYTQRGMEVAGLFEEQDPLKREIKVYDYRGE